MPRLMSEAVATDQVRRREKTVIRRVRWRMIGPASASCALTRRVVPSGLVPATRCRVCATICRVA